MIYYDNIKFRHEFAHLFSGKSTKTAATRAEIFNSSMHQIVCRLGIRPRPHTLGSLQRSPRLLAGLRGRAAKGTGGENGGREGRGKRKIVLCPRKKKKTRCLCASASGLNKTVRSLSVYRRQLKHFYFSHY